jgi:hypothetical protein
MNTDGAHTRSAPSEGDPGDGPGEEPVEFAAAGSRHRTLDAAAFRHRVPVVLSFIGSGDDTDHLITTFDERLHRFGEHCVQLIVVVDAGAAETAERLGVSVPLMEDDGLSERLDARRDELGRVSSVILATDGRAMDVVRQLPAQDQTLAILVALERLTEQFPDRFEPLPSDVGDEPDLVLDPLQTEVPVGDPDVQ